MSTKAIFPTYMRTPLTIERGEGIWLYTSDGTAYLDCASGIAVNALGHSHPALVEALAQQSKKLWHVSNLHATEIQNRLAERLVALSFADRVFFANSGTEATECAIKTARAAFQDTGKDRFIVFEGAFHGRSLAALAAGGNPAYLKGYGEPLSGFDQVRPGDLNVVENAITPKTAAIFIEPIQGESGIRQISHDFLRGLREICDRHDLALIFDEVQCGMARTGKLFAYEWLGIEPDILTLAKGLGGGFPIGACLARARYGDVMGPGSHGSTFGGNALAMAVGNKIVDILSDPAFQEHIRTVGNIFEEKAKDLQARYPSVFVELRGKGLLRGLKCGPPIAEMLTALRAQKLIAVGAGDNVLRLLPPLIITGEEINTLFQRLEAAAKVFCSGKDPQETVRKKSA